MIKSGFAPDKADIKLDDPIVSVKSLYKKSKNQNMASVNYLRKGLVHITVDELVEKASKRVLKQCLDD